jgi:hypothetical protein
MLVLSVFTIDPDETKQFNTNLIAIDNLDVQIAFFTMKVAGVLVIKQVQLLRVIMQEVVVFMNEHHANLLGRDGWLLTISACISTMDCVRGRLIDVDGGGSHEKIDLWMDKLATI